MKCSYYLSPNLADACRASDDLHNSGVKDWFIHIVSKDEAGLQRMNLHSANYVETLGFVHDGLIGAAIGLLLGSTFAGFISATEPFGADVPLIAYLGIMLLLTCFGAWQGGLAGISKENKKLGRFHDEIEAGKFLILVYAHLAEEGKVHAMMSSLHPESLFVGLDPFFYNPFCSPKMV